MNSLTQTQTIYAEAPQILRTVLTQKAPVPALTPSFIFDTSEIQKILQAPTKVEMTDSFYSSAIKEMHRTTVESLAAEANQIITDVIQNQTELESNEKAVLTKLKASQVAWRALGMAAGIAILATAGLLAWATSMTLIPMVITLAAGLGIGYAVYRSLSQSYAREIDSSNEKIASHSENQKNWSLLKEQTQDYQSFCTYLDKHHVGEEEVSEGKNFITLLKAHI